MPDGVPGDTRRDPVHADDRSAPGSAAVHSDVEYEPTGISFVGVAVVLLAFAVTFAGTGLVSWWLLKSHRPAAELPEEQQGSYVAPSEPLPREPRLEPLNAAAGILSSSTGVRRGVMEKTLASYGPGDEEGFVHIPIEQAIELAAGELPVRAPDTDPAPIHGLLDGGEPNSGRLYLEAPPWFREAK